jgi:hypothetical protein
MSLEEYFARAVGLYCGAALANVELNDVVIDYTHLTVETVRDAALRCGLAVGSDEALSECFRIDAKDPKRRITFHDDSTRKQKLISPELRTCLDRYALPSYSQLLTLSPYCERKGFENDEGKKRD